eukprot:CAMPEP_0181203988 /NCGR_PEP_ID=MMETSP1096-20121128/19689_1 /TAXON_ID=156174 ORGANISM="Chrysochromulina ericina, Strain CCMP281" /NCGR_SAMPLE_ID=MMETSP1096 /ASSEMBLY_ACC=CAM_ASM_000453 /LENGTH=144 /DNA_ID=CAMNT_0023294645 /DNA_START=33 /DNA_END=467 /DNA_ORIENTATION=+
MLLCALVAQIHAQTPKTGEKKAGLPGVTPAAKAMSPDAIQLGKLRVVLYDFGCTKPEYASSVPCKGREYVKKLKDEKDAAKKKELMEQHSKEAKQIMALPIEEKKKRSQESFATVKKMWKEYCQAPKDSTVCTNDLMKKTYDKP